MYLFEIIKTFTIFAQDKKEGDTDMARTTQQLTMRKKKYKPRFVAKILKAEQDIAEGKGKRIKIEKLWK